MKVLHCIARLEGGGAETQLGIILKHQFQEIENIVVSYDDYGNGPAKYYYLPQNFSYFKKLKYFWDLCKKEKPDIIHVWLPSLLYLYAIPSFFMKSKKLFAIRNVYKVEGIRTIISLVLYNLSRNVVANTEIESHTGPFRFVFNQKKYFFIPNAIKYNVKEEYLHEYGNVEKTQILFVGRLVKNKNVSTLLKAVALLPNNNWELNIVGKGNDSDNLVNLAKSLNLGNNVIFHDYSNQIDAFYKDADILVLPSLTEGMPNVVFEAALFNVIHILSDIPQHTTWFTHNKNALLFPAREPRKLADCILEAMSMPETKKNEFRDSNKKILSTLTEDRYLASYQNLYKSLL